jgi:hypothetical protein
MDLMEQPRVEARRARRPSAAASARCATSSGTTPRSLSDLPTAIHSSGPKSESPAVQNVASVGEALHNRTVTYDDRGHGCETRTNERTRMAVPVAMAATTPTRLIPIATPLQSAANELCLTAAVRVRSQRQEPACVLDTARASGALGHSTNGQRAALLVSDLPFSTHDRLHWSSPVRP